MKRRDFITGLASAAALPPVAWAQQSSGVPVIGFLHSGSLDSFGHLLGSFRQGLRDSGFVDGRNATIEPRWAEGRLDRLPALANDFVRAQVSVIAAVGPPAALAAKTATAKIPIVFTSGEDPIKIGLVASYNRPGGNVTGVAMLTEKLGAKRLGLLRELAPTATLIAVLLDPSLPTFDTQLEDVEQGARSVGQKVQVLRAATNAEIDTAFATATKLKAGAMLVGAMFINAERRDKLVALAAQSALPTIYPEALFVSAGGLMSYAASLSTVYRQAGIYVGKVLKGEEPSNLPIIQPTKFDLAINLKTARALGLEIPPKILATADEVIE
jgi:putative tryptophan/tyrosine transport system substrate-binding protein